MKSSIFHLPHVKIWKAVQIFRKSLLKAAFIQKRPIFHDSEVQRNSPYTSSISFVLGLNCRYNIILQKAVRESLTSYLCK